MAEAFKYRAFLSYSHADTGVATRVHARLEGFHIDKELIGRVTPTGPIPKALRPIFRDRNDFDAGSSLGAETGTALDDSAALILLASPHTAHSKYANEEVRLFKSRHPDRPLIPLIIDGQPGDVERECFPPALRFAVASDGIITDTPADVLAADLREKGDGFDLAIAKVVARLIGLAPDDVYRRAERERRRQNRFRVAVAAVIAVLAIAGGGLFWETHQQQQTLDLQKHELDGIRALADSLITPAEAAVPGAKRSLTEAITNIAQGGANDPRQARALALLKAGKPKEAEPLLKAVAEEKAKRADAHTDAKDAAEAYRNLASIAAVSDPGRARDYYAEAARLDPSNIEGMYQNGRFQERAGQLDAAQAAFASVIAAAKPGVDDESLVGAKFGMGDIEQTHGDLGAALATYHEAETFVDRLAKSDSGDAVWQLQLSKSYSKVGGVQVSQGNLPAALTSYQASLDILDRLAKSDPGNTQWQDELSGSNENVGDVQVAQGNLPAALTSYQAEFTILDRLAKSDPGNTEWQDDLSFPYSKVGDVQVAQGDLPSALTSYQTSLAIRDKLAKSDPGNAVWQDNLALSYEKVGGVQASQGNLPAALTSYQAEFTIVARLAKSDPGNAGWQNDLSGSYEKIGDVQAEQGNLPAALTSYQAEFTILERLAKSDPGNADWQRDLSTSYEKIGDVQAEQGSLPAALTSYQAAFGILDVLAKSDPGNVGWQGNLVGSYALLAQTYDDTDQPAKAREAFAAGRVIVAHLVAQFPDQAQWKQQLTWFNQGIAALKH